MITLAIILIIAIAFWRVRIFTPESIGKTGEKRVAKRLGRLSDEYIVLNDIMIPTKYGTTQIDHVVVSPYGVFVIETKNYKGWIFGHENSEEWKQSLLGKKRWYGWSSQQHMFRNPIRQNNSHTRAIKHLLAAEGDFKIIPIVVFSDNADLRITTPNHIVINRCNLRQAIRQFDTPCLTDRQIKIIVHKLSSNNITEESARERHAQSVQQLQFHKQELASKGICPRCNSRLVERNGKFGRFIGCSNYPKCDYTRKI